MAPRNAGARAVPRRVRRRGTRDGVPVALASPDDPATPVGVAPFPANVVEGRRWNAAHAYLDPARNRPNLKIVGDVVVDRVGSTMDARPVSSARTGHGSTQESCSCTAGAYFSPAILLRSGIGPAEGARAPGIPPVSALPVGERLLDHYGVWVAWALSPALAEDAAARAREGRLVQPRRTCC